MVHLRPVTLALIAGVVSLAQAGLHTAAIAKGLKYFGTATDNGELTDAPYVSQLRNTDDFGQLTPSNSQKWDATEPSQNTFTFGNGDQIVELGQSNGQTMRCHALVWHSQLPNWVNSGSWTNETLIAVMKNHITKVATHYKGKCYAWDVVNEALNEDGTYRNSVFYQYIGEAYLPIAFATAAAADPDVKLYYNDYNIESPGAKSAGAQRIVDLVKSYGVKIDGVGLQAHFIVGSSPSKSSMISNINSFATRGVEVAFTELDIRMQLPSNDAKLAQQATDYQNTVEACVETDGCVGVTIWDWTDKYSWVPNTFQGYGDACPWDQNLRKKPAYDAILKALGDSSQPPSTLITTTTAPGPTGGGGGAAHWGQCGGNGWTGPTSCESPYTCTKVNEWYYQCL